MRFILGTTDFTFVVNERIVGKRWREQYKALFKFIVLKILEIFWTPFVSEF